MFRERDNPQEESIQKLYMKTTHLYFTRMFQQMSSLHVYPGQMPIFQMLARSEGLSQREIADRMHVKPPTVTMSIKRLEKCGFVRKQPDERDQRVTRIYLTDLGKSTCEKITEIVEQNEKQLFAGFSQSEVCLFRRLMRQMLHNLTEKE